MSGRIWSWQCRVRTCQAELGIVEDGCLYPRPLVPVRIDRQGTVWLRCTAMDSAGRLCDTERGWRTQRRSTAA